MRALTFSEFGDASVLVVREVPDPGAAPGVVVVRTRAIGLNFADVYRRQGRYHLVGKPPWIAGYDACGSEGAVAAAATRVDGPDACGGCAAQPDASMTEAKTRPAATRVTRMA